MSQLTEKIRRHIESFDISYREVDHEPTPTSEASAAARGEKIEIGGKTILLKSKGEFHLFTLSAAKSIDLKKVRKILGSGKLRLASEEELWQVAGVKKGALPPFGKPILPLGLYLDETIYQNERIAFNAGSLTKSFILSVDDYLKLVRPTRCRFER